MALRCSSACLSASSPQRIMPRCAFACKSFWIQNTRLIQFAITSSAVTALSGLTLMATAILKLRALLLFREGFNPFSKKMMSFNSLVTLFNSVFHFGFIADVLSVIGTVFAGFGWWQAKINSKQMTKEKERMSSPIEVILEDKNSKRKIALPVLLRRYELTRSELLGCIGMIPRKDSSKFFVLKYLSSSSFFKELNRIQASDKEENLIIHCSIEEMEQFDV